MLSYPEFPKWVILSIRFRSFIHSLTHLFPWPSAPCGGRTRCLGHSRAQSHLKFRFTAASKHLAGPRTRRPTCRPAQKRDRERLQAWPRHSGPALPPEQSRPESVSSHTSSAEAASAPPLPPNTDPNSPPEVCRPDPTSRASEENRAIIPAEYGMSLKTSLSHVTLDYTPQG